jgi:hypothetical protein
MKAINITTSSVGRNPGSSVDALVGFLVPKSGSGVTRADQWVRPARQNQ